MWNILRFMPCWMLVFQHVSTLYIGWILCKVTQFCTQLSSKLLNRLSLLGSSKKMEGIWAIFISNGKQHVLLKKGTPRDFFLRIKQCLYVLVLFSPDVIKIVSWMLSFKCVKKKFAYLGKRLESWNNHARSLPRMLAFNTPWVFQTTVFFVGKPSKSYQPSQTSESCGTFWF